MKQRKEENPEYVDKRVCCELRGLWAAPRDCGTRLRIVPQKSKGAERLIFHSSLMEGYS